MNSLIAVVTERRQSNRLLPVVVRLKLPLKRSMRARGYSKNRKNEQCARYAVEDACRFENNG